MARYDNQGTIKRICESCGLEKDCICYIDKLKNISHKKCKSCLMNEGILNKSQSTRREILP